MKVLTKSRFKLGLDCPNKLYYTRKKEYPNKKQGDSFLEALAQGGFQVEELARMHYPNGVLIEGDNGAYEQRWQQTQDLLQQENITLYEPAFLIDGLFIRVDVLVKKGNNIQLIEVKSKSFSADDEHLFIGKRGGMVAGWKPYLFDIAFQKYVMQACFPSWNIQSYIMMADKTKKASIDGLNQLFRISKKEGNRTGIIKKVARLEETGSSVLGLKNITEIIAGIEANKYRYHNNLSFQEAITFLKDTYAKDTYANWPTSYGACKDCEFKCTDAEEQQGRKSGFKECFTKQHQWSAADFKKENIFDIYDFRQGKKIFEEGIVFKEQLTEENIGLSAEAGKLSRTHRQILQIEKAVQEDPSIFVDKEGLREEMDSWTYPLHFIDFETSTVALPFNKGLKPYEQVAFQFSHHTYHKDGSITHANEYINNKAGVFPNFEFIRALKKALEIDEGTIFKYSSHENTILNAIYTQLVASNEPDKQVLIDFIQHISHAKKESTIYWKGERDMVDLWEVEKKYYYNPATKGSNSIKQVLPAALGSSAFLREKYAQPISEINLTSKNFAKEHIWLKVDGEQVTSPYKMLPPVFEGWSEEAVAATLSEVKDVADGGAALTAYGKLQYTDMTQEEVDEITKAMLKYCELDTLAMIMIFEHFKEVTA